MFAKTLYGFEDTLADELTTLGATDVRKGTRIVSFCGNKALLYKANFMCRTALRILKPIADFKVKDEDDIYRRIKALDWEQYLTVDKTFVIDSVVYSDIFKHSKYIAFRTKDAIADRFSEKFGKRPSVNVNNPDLYINVHISHDVCTVSLDSSGESLHRRGYRTAAGLAPLNEVLAAGMILKTGWRGNSHFIDPMCGSGTLLIEAALIARNIPPGIFRREFAFERWNDFDRDLFENIYNDDSKECDFKYKCYGSDISPKAIETARENVANAGLNKYIELSVKSIADYQEPPRPGFMVTNPPYGERVKVDDAIQLYNQLGERLKHVFTGYDAWILSNSKDYFNALGLHHKQRIPMLNGEIECEFRHYDIYEGKKKDKL
ncbi:MAG: THUMP domain-containing protein [Tannerella sp.]|nr:THUMP domain-containing protein [Tannerella sp.]